MLLLSVECDMIDVAICCRLFTHGRFMFLFFLICLWRWRWTVLGAVVGIGRDWTCMQAYSHEPTFKAVMTILMMMPVVTASESVDFWFLFLCSLFPVLWILSHSQCCSSLSLFPLSLSIYQSIYVCLTVYLCIYLSIFLFLSVCGY